MDLMAVPGQLFSSCNLFMKKQSFRAGFSITVQTKTNGDGVLTQNFVSLQSKFCYTENTKDIDFLMTLKGTDSQGVSLRTLSRG